MRQMLSPVAVLALLLIVITTEAQRPAPQFGACSWDVDPTQSQYYNIECATVQVPLDYEREQDETIPYHVLRITPKKFAGEASVNLLAQVWFLNGGPGTPGEWLLPFVAVPNPDPLPLQYFLPDHRGTGLSAELTCPDGSQNVEDDGCLQYLKDNAPYLRHFTISNAARDTYRGIKTFATSLPIVLMGTSYGTMLANRFLQLYPEGAVHLVILDSVVDPLSSSAATLDLEGTEVANEFLSLCDKDGFCHRAFNKQPAAKVLQEVVTDVHQGKQVCVKKYWPYLSGREGATRLKSIALSRLVFQATEYFNRMAIPALVYRLRRCMPEDVVAINHFLAKTGLDKMDSGDNWNIPGLPSFVRQSKVTNALIQLSENYYYDGKLRPAELTTKQVEEWDSNSAFSTGCALKFAQLLERGFPLYTPDRYTRQLSNPKCPVLMLNGDLDTATPAKYVKLVHELRPNWYFKPLPLVGHSPSGLPATGLTCPVEIIQRFLMDPSQDPFAGDSACVSKMPSKLDFQGVSMQVETVAREYFGTPNLFGDHQLSPGIDFQENEQ